MHSKIKKIIIAFLVICLIVPMCGCSKREEKIEDKNVILTSLFVYYDFARAITKGVDDVSVQLLVEPGMDDHSFEPTPKDVIRINNADVFIYNGGTIDTWAEKIIKSNDNKNQSSVRMMDLIEEQLISEDSDSDEYYANGEDKHHHEEELEDEELDEHIWTSPYNAVLLMKQLCDRLSEKYPSHKKEFAQNTKAYINKIKKVDKEIRDVVENANNKEIILADKFPLRYFALEYNLKYYAAFKGCSSDSEPSAKTVEFLIKKVKEDNVKGVFYLELSSELMANVIIDDTNAKKYQFNSCHNITMDQYQKGVTYVDLMKGNANVLRKAMK